MCTEIFTSITEIVENNWEVFIAVSALGLAIWQGRAQMKHNRLSVKPHLVFSSVSHHSDKTSEITIKNSGTGPAIFTQFKVYFLDELIPSLSNLAKQTEIASKMSSGSCKSIYGGHQFYSGEALEAGGSQLIFQLNISDLTGDIAAVAQPCLFIDKHLEMLRFEVHYESIYGEQFIYEYPRIST